MNYIDMNNDISINDEISKYTNEIIASRKIYTIDEINKILLDYLPSKYDRKIKRDIILKYLTILIIILDFVIFLGTIEQDKFIFNTDLSIINFIFILIFFILDISWLHYKLQHVVIGSYKLFMDLDILQTNSKYYSGLEIPDSFVSSKIYPNITIQMPVYKEDLENTIKPSIMSALKEARRYNQETKSICNIIICDDGYNIISDEDRIKRKVFYSENDISFSARPHPTNLKRNGRFKKAGNLNFSMNYIDINSQNEMIEKGAIFEGIINYNPYILLIDSDTRLPFFPENQNGCLKRLIKDMIYDGEDTVLYMQCYTSPYLSTKSLSEKCVFNFTCHIYNGILIGTALNSMAPLVGHNALLNNKILKKIANVDSETNYIYYWDENRISEDFDCMMRGCEKGYIGRYVASAGIFLEGVSFNYMTEYFKVSKFACGAAELTFNPISKWFIKGGGLFSNDIIGFILCKEIEWYNKIGIMSYILNFIAVSQAHIAMFYNLIFFEELFNLLPYSLLPINLMWEGMIIWGLINTIINLCFAKRVKFEMYIIFKQQLRELFFTSSLYGSLSVRFSIMYITHLFNLNISFGATQKDDEKVMLIDWIKSTKYECIIYTFYAICILIRLFLFPIVSIGHTFYFGCLPLFMNIFWYWFGPLVYDIFPQKKDKTNTEEYNSEEKMFDDKYNTQIPKSML